MADKINLQELRTHLRERESTISAVRNIADFRLRKNAPAMAEALVKAGDMSEKVHKANVECSISTDGSTVTIDVSDWAVILRSARTFLKCVEGGE